MPDLSALMSSAESMPDTEQVEVARTRIQELWDQYQKLPKVEKDPNPAENTWNFFDKTDWILTSLREIPPRNDQLEAAWWDMRNNVGELRYPSMASKGSSKAIGEAAAVDKVRQRIMEIAELRLNEIELATKPPTKRTLTLQPPPDNQDTEVLGAFLRGLREEAGVSTKWLGDKLKRSDGYIRMLERGSKVASQDTYMAYLAEINRLTETKLEVIKDGKDLRVRDTHGREARMVLVPAATKASLVAQVSESSRAKSFESVVAHWVEDARVTMKIQPVEPSPDLREILLLLATTDDVTLRKVRNLLAHSAQATVPKAPE